jgi:hypothetical protein
MNLPPTEAIQISSILSYGGNRSRFLLLTSVQTSESDRVGPLSVNIIWPPRRISISSRGLRK